MMRALVICALAGCHYHRDTNAPGLVDVTIPPRDITAQELEYPGDPGERMVMVSPGVLAGGGYPGGDFAAEVTVNWGESERSHNDHASRLFIPRGLLWPERGYGVTLGWSALQVREGPDARLGPAYVEVQRLVAPFAIGGGYAIDPTDGDHGPQLHLLAMGTFLRARYLIDGGVEVYLGYQLKIPVTWVWSR